MQRTIEELEALVMAQREEIDGLLEGNAKMSVAYLALRVKHIEDSHRKRLGNVEEAVRQIEGRVEAASKMFSVMKKRLTAVENKHAGQYVRDQRT